MGCSSSKPSKSKPPKSKSKPKPNSKSKPRKSPHPPISRPLPPPTRPPLNQHLHHPYHPPEHIAGDRYRVLLHDNPTFAGRTQKPPTSQHGPAAPVPKPAKPAPIKPHQRTAQPPPQPKQNKKRTPYQFRPLSEIGRAPIARVAPPRSSSKNAPRVPPPSGPLPRLPTQQKQKQGQAQGQGKYGGIKKDSHGVWCVQLLADGRWYRCVDVGVKVPGF